ncbi:hypothetical protein Q5M79_06335 [Acinetobacter baumannii]|nr:hypothetical protein [Acinetobacter baumannii]
MDKYKAIAEKITYSLDGYIADHNNRNFGDADLWLRHVRNRWEQFIEAHPDSYNFHEYLQHQQAKVEELQRRNQMLNDNIKEQGQKLVYQNEVIETQAEKLLGLRDEKAELQKRVDAALAVLTEYYTGSYDESPDLVVDIEQALKGEG